MSDQKADPCCEQQVSFEGGLLKHLDRVSGERDWAPHEVGFEIRANCLRRILGAWTTRGDDCLAYAYPVEEYFSNEELSKDLPLGGGDLSVWNHLQNVCKDMGFYVCLANIERIAEVNREITYWDPEDEWQYDERPEETCEITVQNFVDSDNLNLFDSVKMPFDAVDMLDEDYFSNSDPDTEEAHLNHDFRFVETLERTVGTFYLSSITLLI